MHSHSSHLVDDATKQLDNFFLNGIKMQINLYSPLPDMVVSAILFCSVLANVLQIEIE